MKPLPVLPNFRNGTLVMGILNITPDSFSGDGLLSQIDPVNSALEQARQFVNDGAHILDIGGESTRPGSQPITADDELSRVLPVVIALSNEFPGTILSVDTYKAQVAEKVLQAGAHWINDVWGLRADPALAEVISRHQAHVVLMHNRSKPGSVEISDQLGGHYIGSHYADLLAEIKSELMASVELARNAGIPDERIILDPGIGFGKTITQNLVLVNRLDEICGLGFPVLLGVSRKSFIGYTLDLPPQERLEGSLAANALGVIRGARILRVHDVRETVRMAKMMDAILQATVE